MSGKLEKVLADRGFGLEWADERRRDSRAGWSGVADVACSRKLRCVSVPRRRRGPHHAAEVLHEVAHLEIWLSTGKSPARQDDAEVCKRALEIAREYGFNQDTIEMLMRDLSEQST